MKIYTKTGDKGETSLFTGKRVLKSNDLVNIFGQLDELNSHIGVLMFKNKNASIALDLKKIQEELFVLGSYFASEFTAKQYEVDSNWLEEKMDLMDEDLQPLKNFILPGGAEAACYAHICRTVTRKAERAVVKLESPVETESSVIYLNRLSDYFFVLARFFNYLEGCEEPIWNPSK